MLEISCREVWSWAS